MPSRAPPDLLTVGEPSSLASLKLARRVLSVLPLAPCRKRTPRRDLPIISDIAPALRVPTAMRSWWARRGPEVAELANAQLRPARTTGISGDWNLAALIRQARRGGSTYHLRGRILSPEGRGRGSPKGCRLTKSFNQAARDPQVRSSTVTSGVAGHAELGHVGGLNESSAQHPLTGLPLAPGHSGI